MKQGLAFALFILLMIALACGDPDPPNPPNPPQPDDITFPVVATGGGWFEDGGKVTFGFNGHVDRVDEEYVYKGQMQFNDHAGGVNFHGKVELITCNFEIPWTCAVEGSYRPQPTKLGDPGYFKLTVKDSGSFTASSGDYFELELTGGVYDGRSYDATLSGGNIEVHEAE